MPGAHPTPRKRRAQARRLAEPNLKVGTIDRHADSAAAAAVDTTGERYAPWGRLLAAGAIPS